MIKINGKEIIAKEFMFDGDHKIFILEDKAAKDFMFVNGWEQTDIFPIEQIADKFAISDGLRFIHSCKGNDIGSVVEQFVEKVVFEINGKVIEQKFDYD